MFGESAVRRSLQRPDDERAQQPTCLCDKPRHVPSSHRCRNVECCVDCGQNEEGVGTPAVESAVPNARVDEQRADGEVEERAEHVLHLGLSAAVEAHGGVEADAKDDLAVLVDGDRLAGDVAAEHGTDRPLAEEVKERLQVVVDDLGEVDGDVGLDDPAVVDLLEQLVAGERLGEDGASHGSHDRIVTCSYKWGRVRWLARPHHPTPHIGMVNAVPTVRHLPLRSGTRLTLTEETVRRRWRTRTVVHVTGPLPRNLPVPDDATVTDVGDPHYQLVSTRGRSVDAAIKPWVATDPLLDLNDPEAVDRAWLSINACELSPTPPPPDTPVEEIEGWLAARLGYRTGTVPRPVRPLLEDAGLLWWSRAFPADPTVRETLDQAIIVTDVTGAETPGTGLVDVAAAGQVRAHADAHVRGGLGSVVWSHMGIRWPVFPVTMVWRRPSVLLSVCGWHAHLEDPAVPAGPFELDAKPGWRRGAVRDLAVLADRVSAGALPMVGHDHPLPLNGPLAPSEVVVRTDEERRRVLDRLTRVGVRELAGRPVGDVVRTDPGFFS